MTQFPSAPPASSFDISPTLENDFPTFPEVHTQLVNILDRPHTSIWDIESIIRCDPAVTINVLRLAGRVTPGLRPPAVTVAQAIRTVGYAALKQWVFTMSVFTQFQPYGDAPLSYTDYWAHCLGTAIAAKQLAVQVGVEQPEEFFIAGLLHDIGKFTHNQYFPEQFRAALTLATTQRLTLHAAEQQVFGFSHTDTGRQLAQEWQLAPTLQQVVAHYHMPEDRDLTPPTLHEHIVHCAAIISYSLKLGEGGDQCQPHFVPRSWEALHLTPSHLTEVVATTKHEFACLMNRIPRRNGSAST